MTNNGCHCFSLKCVLNCILAVGLSPLQIHILESGEVRIFSRNQEDNTSKYPDIISRIPKVTDGSTWSAAARPPGRTGERHSDFQMSAFTATPRTTANIHHTRSLSSCPTCSFHHSSVRFSTHSPPPPVCSHPSLFKSSQQQLFGHLIVYPKLPFLLSSHTKPNWRFPPSVFKAILLITSCIGTVSLTMVGKNTRP